MNFAINKNKSSDNPFPYVYIGKDPPGYRTCLFHASDLTPAAKVPIEESSWAMQYVIAIRIRRCVAEGKTSAQIRKETKEWSLNYTKYLQGKVYKKTIDHAISLSLKLEMTGRNTRPDEAVHVGEGKYFKLRFPRNQK